MKKTLLALVFLCEISQGMGDPLGEYRKITNQFAEHSRLRREWTQQFYGPKNFEKRGTIECKQLEDKRDAAKPGKFDPAILENVIRYSIGSDSTALEAFQLLFNNKLHNTIDFYLENSAQMLPINAARFKEILLLIAPILNVQSVWDEDIEFTCRKEYEIYIHKIVSIWGGNPKIIKYDMIEHPQFCFEVFLALVLKLEDSEAPGSGILFQAVECMADEFLHKYEWDGKEGEIALYGRSIGNSEDDGGGCRPWDIWPNWDEDEEERLL